MRETPNFSGLLDRCLTIGDESAWRAFVGFLQPQIAGVAARSALRWGPVRPETVEDLTQDAFAKLCENRFAILRRVEDKTDEAILAFIKVTVANLVHDRFRAERSGKRFPRAGFLAPEALDHWLGQTETIDTMDRDLLLAQVDRILERKLSGNTSARDRQVFWLHHRSGMTAKAIASIPAIGLSEKGVESLLFRLGAAVKEEFSAGERDYRGKYVYRRER